MTEVAYFKNIAEQHLDIAHDTLITEGSEEKRCSFFRLGKSQELSAAIFNKAHFPCLVYADVRIRYNADNNTQAARRRKFHTLYVFSAVDQSISNEIDKQEAAYDAALEVAEEIISYMNEDQLNNGFCAAGFRFKPDMVVLDMEDLPASNLYGWRIQIESMSQKDFIKNPAKWIEP